MLFIISIIFLSSFPYEIYKGFSTQRDNLLTELLVFLSKISVLDYLSGIYILFFCVPRPILIKRYIIICFISLCYITISRYYFYHVTFLHEHLLYSKHIIYIILVLGIAVTYYRILLSISMFFVFMVLRTNNPSLLHPVVLYVLGETPDEPKSSNPSPRNYSLFHINQSRNYYRENFKASNHGLHRNVGYGIGFFGLVVGFGAAYYGKVQADASLAQVKAQEINNFEMRRQNDLEEVSQGLMSKEDYTKKYPKT